MAKWWDDRPAENVFVEVRRDNIGDDLQAPITSRRGTATGGYSLVPLVKPGNLVVHYDSRHSLIEGASVAIGPPEPRSLRWVARGRSARAAHAKPEWKDGIAVPLHFHHSLTTPIRYADLQHQQTPIIAIHDRLEAEFGTGTPLHYPWYERPSDETIRAQQSYLLKLPRATVRLFPEIEKVLAQAEADWTSAPVVELSEVDEAREQVERAAGHAPARPGRRPGGQRFATDQAAKVAIETRAMNAAAEYFDSAGYEVEDVHANESFDLLCRRGGLELHVEVKGTTTPGTSVLLTPNEVDHARTYPHLALYVLSEISIRRDTDGTVLEAVGGRATLHQPWVIDDGELRAVGYEHDVPMSGLPV